jgi:hypothetical protein
MLSQGNIRRSFCWQQRRHEKPKHLSRRKILQLAGFFERPASLLHSIGGRTFCDFILDGGRGESVNLRQTAEVAALVATSAAHIVESPRCVPTPSLHGYWKQSRTRLRCWFAALRTARLNAANPITPNRHTPHQSLIELSREILVAEMLTRVWSTVLVAHDQRRESELARAAVDAVFRGQQEARHEVLRLLAEEGVLPQADQLSLNRFRLRIERWTDALLGPLVAAYDVEEFAFDPQRAREFSRDGLHGPLRGAAERVMPLLLAGLATAVPAQTDADQERLLLNLAVVRAVLSAYPGEAFGGQGQLRTPLAGQIERSPRHPESPLRNSAAKTGGMSFIELRRREQRPEKTDD